MLLSHKHAQTYAERILLVKHVDTEIWVSLQTNVYKIQLPIPQKLDGGHAASGVPSEMSLMPVEHLEDMKPTPVWILTGYKANTFNGITGVALLIWISDRGAALHRSLPSSWVDSPAPACDGGDTEDYTQDTEVSGSSGICIRIRVHKIYVQIITKK